MVKLKSLKGKLIYLASPYSHPDPDVRTYRFVEVTKIAGYLIKNGLAVLTPITASHEISKICKIKGSWEMWKQVDIPQIKVCDILMVALMDGWENSVGISAETRLAKKLNKQILYINPKTYIISENNNV